MTLKVKNIIAIKTRYSFEDIYIRVQIAKLGLV